jgi:hypothetical protein
MVNHMNYRDSYESTRAKAWLKRHKQLEPMITTQSDLGELGKAKLKAIKRVAAKAKIKKDKEAVILAKDKTSYEKRLEQPWPIIRNW